jgi:hypothetical protein
MLIGLLVLVLAALVFFASQIAPANPSNPTGGSLTIPALLVARQQTATAREQINLAYRETNYALRQTNNVVYGGTLTREAELTKTRISPARTSNAGD